MSTELFAFTLTLLAGLATGIGSAIAFFAKKESPAFLSCSLGFSAGVMIYVSFMEILPKSIGILAGEHGEKPGHWLAVAGFFAGVAVIAVIDRFVPETTNPHEFHTAENFVGEPGSKDRKSVV